MYQCIANIVLNCIINNLNHKNNLDIETQKFLKLHRFLNILQPINYTQPNTLDKYFNSIICNLKNIPITRFDFIIQHNLRCCCIHSIDFLIVQDRAIDIIAELLNIPILHNILNINLLYNQNNLHNIRINNCDNHQKGLNYRHHILQFVKLFNLHNIKNIINWKNHQINNLNNF